MRLAPLTLSGSLVRLEPLTRAHTRALASVGLDPELWRLQPRTVESLSEMEAYVDLALDEQERGFSLPFVIVSQTGQREVIGSTRFMDIALEHRRLEIGATWLTATHQRTGANVEAKLLLLGYAFDTLGIQRVVLKTESSNHQSRSAILALGAAEEGTFRRHLIADNGRLRDMVYFAILDSQWPEVRSRLLARLEHHASGTSGSADAGKS